MREDRIFPPLGLAILLSVTAWVFWGSLSGPFHFDDALFLQSPQVTVPGDPWYLLRPSQTRQLSYLSFYWNYRLGATNPRGYHLVNLLLHLANVAGLYLLTALLINRRRAAISEFTRRWLPLAAAGIYALHPVQSEAVNYVYERSTLLAAFFVILSTASYLKAREEWRNRAYKVVCLMCFLLACASKEIAFVLPLVWLALLWAETTELKAFYREVRASVWHLAVLAGAAIGGGWVLFILRKHGESTVGLSAVRHSLQYFLSQVQALATYLRMVAWPSGLSVDHDFRPAGFASAYAMWCYALLVFLSFAAFILRKRRPYQAFLIAAFLLFLAPTSSLIPSADLLFEHRLYLPMIAGSILISWLILYCIGHVLENESRRSIASFVIFGSLFAVWAGVSRERTYIWADEVRLWKDASEKAPLKARPHYNLATACLFSDRPMARAELLETIRLEPKHSSALYNLGWLVQTEGDYDSARRYFMSAVEADPGNWQAHHSLGNVEFLKGGIQEAKPQFQITISLRPDYWPAYQSLATLQLQLGETRSALETLVSLKKLQPELLSARCLMADVLMRVGRTSEAKDELDFITDHDGTGLYRNQIKSLRDRLEMQSGDPR